MQIPEVCPNCRAMPVNDQTPPGLYRLHGECQCGEENTMNEFERARPDGWYEMPTPPPEPNTVFFRVAHIEVAVDTKWLTEDGECSVGDGWEDLQKRIEWAISGIFAGRYKFPATPQLTWDGWDGEPEEEGGA